MSSDTAASFVTVRDDRGNRRFKIKFRTHSEFFDVTVAKLRRAVVSAVSSSSDPHHHSSDLSAFALIFEDTQGTGDVATLPHGALAEHAKIADWGVRPGDSLSLRWETATVADTSPYHRSRQHDFQAVEDIATPAPAAAAAATASQRPSRYHSDYQQQQQHQPPRNDISNRRHDDDDDEDDALAALLADPNLTEEQRQLQLKWLRDTNVLPPAPEAPKLSSSSLLSKPPLAGFHSVDLKSSHWQQEEEQEAEQSGNTTLVTKSLLVPAFGGSSSTPPPAVTSVGAGSLPPLPSLFAGSPSGADRQQHHQHMDARAGLDDDYADLDYVSHHDEQQQHQEEQQSLVVPSKSSSNSQKKKQLTQIEEEIEGADRRENTKLRHEIIEASGEVQLWQERAKSAFGMLESRLSERVVGSPDSRRALANALVDIETLQKKLDRQQKQLATTTAQLDDERRVRRELQRELEQLRGHVRVVVRVRNVHNNSSSTSPLSISDGSLVTVNRGSLKPRGQFEFFRVVEGQSQESFFLENVYSPLVGSLERRESICLFAYGHTGAGKTHTMLNQNTAHAHITADTGVALRAAKTILEHVRGMQPNSAGAVCREQHDSAPRRRFDVAISIVDLYCDQLRDLLSDQQQQHQQQTNGNNQGPTLCVFRDVSEAADLIARGASQRWTAETNSNAMSSRSHCLITFTVIRLEDSQPEMKVVLVDLAGSERLKKSGSDSAERLVETKFIHKSLSALGDVVHAMTTAGSKHVPFRNSSLTMLLQDTMSGNATTVMIACVTDDESSAEETYSTLSFASRVRCVKNVQFARGELRAAMPVAAAAAAKAVVEKPAVSAPTTFTKTVTRTSSSATPRARAALTPVAQNTNARSASSASSSSSSRGGAFVNKENSSSSSVNSSRSSSSCTATTTTAPRPVKEHPARPRRKTPQQRQQQAPAVSTVQQENNEADVVVVDDGVPCARVSLQQQPLPQQQQQQQQHHHQASAAGFASSNEAARLRTLLAQRKRSPTVPQ